MGPLKKQDACSSNPLQHTSHPHRWARIGNPSQWNIWALKSQQCGRRFSKGGRTQKWRIISMSGDSPRCVSVSKSRGRARGDKRDETLTLRLVRRVIYFFFWFLNNCILHSCLVRTRRTQSGGFRRVLPSSASVGKRQHSVSPPLAWRRRSTC